MLCTEIVSDIQNNFCTQHVLPRFELGVFMYRACNSMNNLLSYCGLVDAKIRASDKDLPVRYHIFFDINKTSNITYFTKYLDNSKEGKEIDLGYR